MKRYDAIIVGGGITGTALLYVLSRYTNLSTIALLEKYPSLAQLNSHAANNSQTLHTGDIETNYNYERAKIVQEAAMLVACYLESVGKDERIHRKEQKMVLAVGEKEVQELEQRYEEIKSLFPILRKAGREELVRLEPKLIQDRDPGQKVLALATEGYTIDFAALAASFVRHSLQLRSNVDLFLQEEVKQIRRQTHGEDEEYILSTKNGRTLMTKVVVLAAGAHSLVFAKQLGYGKEYGLLPVKGNYYCGRNLLRGKVYRVQHKKLPFAAVHGDPNFLQPAETRFGPTTHVLPLLERGNLRTFKDLLKTWRISGIISLLTIIADPVMFRFLLRNVVYQLPVVGKWSFLQDVRKIIPSLKYHQVRLAKGVGGIRPQMVHMDKKRLEMSECKIVGKNIIFDITPSPGASVCLKNAEENARMVVGFLGGKYSFDEARWKKDFY